MINSFPYSDTNKRYHTFTYYLSHKFGKKVAKISLDAGFTCPNIDGTKGIGGCTYCSGRGSGDFAGDPAQDLVSQFNDIKCKMKQKWHDTLYIPYFQAHTNTYAPLSVLKEKFETVLELEDVVGISIATRADCISDECADYLQTLSERTYLEVELGLQSVHDITGQRINRCHNYNDFLECFQKLKKRNIFVCVHIINGLPGETPEMMLETVNRLAKLGIHSIKIHLLHVLRGTALENELASGAFELLSKEAYVAIVCDQLELLPPEVVVQRVTGDGDSSSLIGPDWSLKKLTVMNEIDKELARRNSFQGSKFFL